MSKFKGIVQALAILLGTQASFSIAPAEAHGVVVPVPTAHTLAAANALKALLLHRHATTLPIAGIGTGSATVRLNAQILKSIVSSGYSSGQNYAISQQVGGLLSSGRLSGSVYFNNPGTTTYGRLGPTYSTAFGSDPFNTGSLGGATTIPTGNVLSFANGSGIFAKHGIGSGVPYFGGVSGAERARTNLYKLLARTSTSAGEKSITSYGPVSGGLLHGALGESFGGNVRGNLFAAYAFGNNGFNSTALTTLQASQLSNYITFANGTRLVTGGQLAATFYSPGFNYGPYILAFGNSPYNNLTTTYQYSLIKSIINFAALK